MSIVSDRTIQSLRDSYASGSLVDSLERDHLLAGSEADALGHALLDIAEAVNRVYDKVLPELLARLQTAPPEQLENLLEDLREEFRHIDYHIHDAKLTDL